jgi:5-methylcytosine-specific restriction endonuclease McrA
MNNRTKYTNIPPKVREAVEKRDSIDGHPCCIFCGSPNARGEAHIVPRSQGGEGIEQNIITVCRDCHRLLDSSQARDVMKKKAINYLLKYYPAWTVDSVTYDKWGFFKNGNQQ